MSSHICGDCGRVTMGICDCKRGSTIGERVANELRRRHPSWYFAADLEEIAKIVNDEVMQVDEFVRKYPQLKFVIIPRREVEEPTAEGAPSPASNGKDVPENKPSAQDINVTERNPNEQGSS